MSGIELINTAHADPEVRGLRLSSTRGGDESRCPPVAAVEVHGAEAEGGGSCLESEHGRDGCGSWGRGRGLITAGGGG